MSDTSQYSKSSYGDNLAYRISNLNSEIEALVKIQDKMIPKGRYIWRYATKVGEIEDQDFMQSGWILED